MLFLASLLLCQAAAAVELPLPVWPLPSTVDLADNNHVALDGSFKFSAAGDYGTVINNAIERYETLISVPEGSSGTVKSCKLSVADSAEVPIINADESYSIEVDKDGVCTISSQTIWGALRGLESFTHFLVRNPESFNVELVSTTVSVADKPRFGHRGMLIDTARHYLTVPTIQRVIDALPVNKFNVLHWHAVDAESFPIETPSEPTMTKGAFSPSMVYTQDDIRALTEYAYERGVEVIFEIDVPGHAAGWTAGKPEIMADCFKKYYYNINDFALDPTLDLTYETLGHVLGDIVTAAGPHGSSRLHIGGDEVVTGCWANDSSIVDFMHQQGYTSYYQLLNYFVQRADGIVAGLGRKAIHWEEVFTNGCNVSHDNIFQVWTDSSVVSKLTSANYQVIASPSNYWYLNIASNTWQVVYSYNPTMGLASQAQKDLVIGGEVALWGEFVDDNNIISTLYPRAAAGGERLWSAESVTDQDAAEHRLQIQRCRLVNRGFSAGPVGPSGYCQQVHV